jgi:hypothetical protein
MAGSLYYKMEGSLKWLEYSFCRCIDIAAAQWAIIIVSRDIISPFEFTQHLYNRYITSNAYVSWR